MVPAGTLSNGCWEGTTHAHTTTLKHSHSVSQHHLFHDLLLLPLVCVCVSVKSARAVKVLKECIRLKPDDPTIPLLAVKLCIGTLHWVSTDSWLAVYWNSTLG